MAELVLDIPEVDFGVRTSKVKLKQVRLANDNSGAWTIDVDFIITTGARRTEEELAVLKMKAREFHGFSAAFVVTRADIASKAMISEEHVRTSLTVDQLNTVVMGVVLDRISAFFVS